ncbi:MAG: fatty acid desaturase [Actinomycetota bacterium]
MAATLVPDPASLPAIVETDRITASGRPAPAFREELRRIPDLRNALAVAACWGQVAALVVTAVRLDRWWAWGAAFLLMGPIHARFAALMHEAAHRLLFSRRRLNDFVGRGLLGFPTFTPIDAYRREPGALPGALR